MGEAVIIGALRTPSGRLLGGLSALSAPELCAPVIRELVSRAGIRPKDVDEVILGNVLSAGVGQNPARQASVLAGLPYSTGALTVNMVCASGMRAVILADEIIRLGEADVIVAGGMESMSNAPYLVRDLRGGRRYGDSALVDSLIYDGLCDHFYNAHMGALCELTAGRYKVSREDQDAFALASHKKAAAARSAFAGEVVPIEVNGTVVSADETIRRDTSLERLSRLKPAFKAGGTVTAGNSPGLNDAAACLLLASREKARSMGVEPLAEITGSATAHLDPKWYTMAPVRSVRALLKKTGLELEAFDLVEENEAFAAQSLAVIRELGLDPARVNVNGGAIALGHPIGASGARILVTLINALGRRSKKTGLATICLGGGGAVSMALRAL